VKIDCHQIFFPSIRNDSTNLTQTNSKQSNQATTDDIRLNNQEQIHSLLTDNESDPGVDLDNLAAVAASMVNGVYQVPAEQVADAILYEADCLREILK
jgi:anti-sigma28 factor (negative regulator of flagellin synthesis)